jgi:hypothetical protein
MTKKFRAVIELLLPDEERYKNAASVHDWLAAWVRDDLIYEADSEWDGEVIEVTELPAEARE